MTWQDAVLTVVSLAFVVALVPSVVKRQVAPLSTCLLTAAGLTIIGAVDVTLHLTFTAITTGLTAALWWACAYIATTLRGES